MCLKCPPGTFTTSSNSTSCQPCPAGKKCQNNVNGKRIISEMCQRDIKIHVFFSYIHSVVASSVATRKISGYLGNLWEKKKKKKKKRKRKRKRKKRSRKKEEKEKQKRRKGEEKEKKRIGKGKEKEKKKKKKKKESRERRKKKVKNREKIRGQGETNTVQQTDG